MAFTMSRDGDNVLCAKSKDRRLIQIGRGAVFHNSSSTPLATLAVSDITRPFSLRESQGNSELITIDFSLPLGKDAPRDVTLALVAPVGGLPTRFTSRQPKWAPGGRLAVDLSGRYGRRSVKNCALVDEGDRGLLLLLVRKIDSNTLIVEAVPRVADLVTFALGIASFVCQI
jgi:hypothetical protein